jgi:uncharacterized protein DUF2513
MKRDIELIRLILLREEQGTPPPALASYGTGLVLYNSALAIEAGLLRGEVLHEGGSNIPIGNVRGITWAGHDFLDATRDPRIWNKTRNRALALGTSWKLLLDFIDDQTRRRLWLRRH